MNRRAFLESLAAAGLITTLPAGGFLQKALNASDQGKHYMISGHMFVASTTCRCHGQHALDGKAVKE